MRIHDPSSSRDRMLATAGLVAMAAGVVLGVVGYVLSHGTTNALQQRDALVLAVVGLSVSVAGSAVYLRAALAGFLRFWLLRDIHERRAQVDRLLSSPDGPSGTVAGDLAPGDEPGSGGG
jgi:hypothetical protein